jgi:hypothetical protein
LSSTVMRSWEQRDDGGPWKWREVEDRSVARSFMLMHAPVTYVRTATHPCQLRLQRAYDPPLTCGRSVSESMLAMAMHALHGSESRASPWTWSAVGGPSFLEPAARHPVLTGMYGDTTRFCIVMAHGRQYRYPQQVIVYIEISYRVDNKENWSEAMYRESDD